MGMKRDSLSPSFTPLTFEKNIRGKVVLIHCPEISIVLGKITSNHWHEDDLIEIPIKTFFLLTHKVCSVARSLVLAPCVCAWEFILYIFSFSYVSVVFLLLSLPQHSIIFLLFCFLSRFFCHFPIPRTLNKILIFIFACSLVSDFCAVRLEQKQNNPVQYIYIYISSYVIIKWWVYAREITYIEHYSAFALAHIHIFFGFEFKKKKERKNEAKNQLKRVKKKKTECVTRKKLENPIERCWTRYCREFYSLNSTTFSFHLHFARQFLHREIRMKMKWESLDS